MIYQYRCRCIEWRMQRVDVDRMGDDAHDVPHDDLYDIGYTELHRDYLAG
jgi:hypothetical protein